MGGPADAVERAKPLLRPMAAAFHHIGPLGRAARFKLAVNFLLGAQIAAMAEVLGALARDGFDEKAAVDMLTGNPVMSPAAANYARLMAERRRETFFPVDLIAKDLGYAVKAASEKGLAAPIAEAALGVFREAAAAGLGRENASSVRKLYE